MSSTDKTFSIESSENSISRWLGALKEGDADAAQSLWDRFFERLVKKAADRVKSCPNGVVEPEDIAVSVFESLWKGAQQGRFKNVTNRDELWWLLLSITRKKAASHIRRETAQKRGGDNIAKELAADGNPAGEEFGHILSFEPTAEYVAIFEEELSRLMALLRDDQLRQIAVLKIEGYSNEEICTRQGIAAATVTRKMRLIRQTWAEEFEQ